MRSRISLFNRTVFRKDLTRFVPVWLIYSTVCVLVFVSLHQRYGFRGIILDAEDYVRSNSQGHGYMFLKTLSAMAVANCIYAPVCALLLFGDLFKSRLCNALHAMPLKREGWFLTHGAAGMCFALIPYGLTALCMLPFMKYHWFMALLWFLGAMLEFWFFFSVAVLCVFCTGSRFASAVVYALVNYLVAIAAAFLIVIYSPLLTGVTINTGGLILLMPVAFLTSFTDWTSWFDKQSRAEYGIGLCWIYLLIVSVLAVGIYCLALRLYKRRKLECAGDFVTVRWLKPVFLVVYTLTAAMFSHGFGLLFTNDETVGGFFFVGLALGWFTGLMLQKRSVRVFRGKTILGFVVLTAVLLISILLTWADPLGITRWVPKAGEVSSVVLDGYGYYAEGVEIAEPEEIADIADIHSQTIEEKADTADQYGYGDPDSISLTLRYHMKSGTVRERSYKLDISSDLVNRLLPYFSDPEVILDYENWEDFLGELYQIRVDGNDNIKFTGEDAVSLAEAIRADCEAGNMVQYSQFHTNEEGVYYGEAATVDIVAGDRHFEITIYDDCENTKNWLVEHGAVSEYYLDEKYG